MRSQNPVLGRKILDLNRQFMIYQPETYASRWATWDFSYNSIFSGQ
ncbi:MAG TPA: hypothetical protein VEX68_21500 [Bryobacteraceae bacterium]|nr:hypothetical protein [Bryobacteraceae bacterium]